MQHDELTGTTHQDEQRRHCISLLQYEINRLQSRMRAMSDGQQGQTQYYGGELNRRIVQLEAGLTRIMYRDTE